MKRLLTLALCLLPLVCTAQKPSPEDEQALNQAEYALCQAFVKGDADRLAVIEADGYMLTGPNGMMVPRKTDIDNARTGGVRYSTVSTHETSIRVYGNTAIITGRTVIQGFSKERPFEGIFQFTDTFSRIGTEWRLVAAHATRVAPTARSSIEPLPRDSAWVTRHEGFVETARKGGINVLFLGDSITDFWRQPDRGFPVWEKNFAALGAANFGISGDRTQHVLWRMQNGELDGLHPRAVVLMIGTNNTGLERDKLTPRNSPEEVVAGVTAIVNGLRSRLPDTRILLLGIFPRGATPDDPQRLQILAINREIARLHNGSSIHFLDIGSRFLQSDGTLSKDVMPDFLHPGPRGYEIWADAIREPLAALLTGNPAHN